MSSGSNPIGKRACIGVRRANGGHAQSCGIPPVTPFASSKPPSTGGATADVMESAVSARSRHARRLFAGIALSYEWVATVLSLGQDPRWRRALVAAVCAKNDDRVLDVATGTGMVARALIRRYACRVIGLDQSADMPAAGAADGRPLVRAQGERLPFADESFDHVTFTYLLRYVDDPAATIRELTRVLRPSGRLPRSNSGCQPTLCGASCGAFIRASVCRSPAACGRRRGARSAIFWDRASRGFTPPTRRRRSSATGGPLVWRPLVSSA